MFFKCQGPFFTIFTAKRHLKLHKKLQPILPNFIPWLMHNFPFLLLSFGFRCRYTFLHMLQITSLTARVGKLQKKQSLVGLAPDQEKLAKKESDLVAFQWFEFKSTRFKFRGLNYWDLQFLWFELVILHLASSNKIPLDACVYNHNYVRDLDSIEQIFCKKITSIFNP